MNNVEELLVAHEARSAIERTRAGGGDFEAECRAAARAAKDHWMVLDENKQYRGYCLAIYECADDERKAWLEVEFHNLKILSAMLSGVPIADNAFRDYPEGYEVAGIMKLWKDTKSGHDEFKERMAEREATA